mgnify:CR=1 FL=1
MTKFQNKLHEIIFEADTPVGKAFDIVLLFAIVLSILVVMLESVASIKAEFGYEFAAAEWFFTIIFTAEYLMRILVIKRPLKYIISFYGIIDLLSVLPTYIGLFMSGAESLLILRSLRLLRVFRVMKLTRYLGEANVLGRALMASRRKILVFLLAVIMVTIIMGTFMFMIEGAVPDSGFTSIPRSIYWAIVTLTTVGYGDISPVTTIGQIVASIIMILGYGIIAVPTGIVTAEMTKPQIIQNTQHCANCGEEDHLDGAKYCHNCGEVI